MKRALFSGLIALTFAVPAVGVAQDFGGSFDTAPDPVVKGPNLSGDTDDFGGSFDAPAPSATPDTPDTTGSADVAEPEDSFGGSFGDTAVETVPEAGTVPSVDAAAPPPEPIVVDQAIYDFESRDYWVPPARNLRNGNVHGPTPVSLPGGYVLSTQGLVDAIVEGVDFYLIDVLGGDYAIPGAFVEPGMGQGGSFDDRVQQQTEGWLANLTGGDAGYPIVVYCSGPECWLSYNAALRAIAAGYEAVYWYRGGLRAWDMAGLRLEPASF